MKKTLFSIIFCFLFFLTSCSKTSSQPLTTSAPATTTPQPTISSTPPNQQEKPNLSSLPPSSQFVDGKTSSESLKNITYLVPSCWTADRLDMQNYYTPQNGKLMVMADNTTYDFSEKEFQDSFIKSFMSGFTDADTPNITNTYIDAHYAAELIFHGTLSSQPMYVHGFFFTDDNGYLYSIVLGTFDTTFVSYEEDFRLIINSVKIHSTSEIPNSTEIPNKETQPITECQSYGPGQYCVGRDIPTGEYIILSTNGSNGYFCLSKDDNATDIIYNQIFDYNSIVSVKKGEYLELNNAEAYPFRDWCAHNKLDTSTNSSMFKIGVNLPAGKYKLKADTDNQGYYCIFKDNRGQDIITNDIFEGQSYITVKKEQYLEISHCTICKQ